MFTRMRWLIPALLFTVTAVGCGPAKFPVRGTVTFDDGSPVTIGGTIVFETTVNERAVMARGAIKADGSYELSTETPGDGALPGKYRVKIVPAEPDVDFKGPRGPSFDKKYMSFETSGLEIEIESKANDIPIRVGMPKN